MNDSFNKYFTLMGLLLLSLVGMLLLFAGLFYLLKLFSVVMFNIPGSGWFFSLFITTAPYLILFAAYYVVFRSQRQARRHPATTTALMVLLLGSICCVGGLLIALLEFFKVSTGLISWYKPFSKYSFAAHLLLILLAAGIMATGEPREKSWLDREA